MAVPLPLHSVSFVEFLLAGIQTHGFTVDEHQIDVSPDVQRISVGHNEVRRFSFVDRAQPIGNSIDLGSVQGYGLVCLFLWKSEGDGSRSLVRKVARSRRTE